MTISRVIVGCMGAVCVLAGAASRVAAETSAPDPFILVDTPQAYVRARLSATIGAFGSAGTWYGLDTLTNGSTYRQDRGWGEGWLSPGVDFVLRPQPGFEAYGSLSLGLSGTLLADPFDTENRGAASFENAFVGVRTTGKASDLILDFSIGRQTYGVGTGMLLWQGAGNGFERGAVSLLPRRSWAMAAIGRASFQGFKVEAFYLDPNELPSSNTGTRLVGGVVEYAWGQKSRLGVAVSKVIASSLAYPLPSLPLFIENGRDGLVSWQGYTHISGDHIGLSNAWIRAEGAVQRNDRIDMSAGAWYAEIGNRFPGLLFSPSVSYGYASFSGDNPRTSAYERFDPLFYGNGLDNWWFGSTSAYAFLNANVNYHRVSTSLTISARDFVKVQFIRSAADKLNSPIQFGQGARPGVVNGDLVIITGVSKPHLADEVYVEWTRIHTKQIATTLWASIGFPGDGLNSLPRVQTRNWAATGFVLSINY